MDSLTQIVLGAAVGEAVLGKKIGKQVRIVPELAFYVDDSLDYADKIDRLLR